MRIDKKELTVPKQKATKALQKAEELKIKNDEQLDEGTDLLGIIKTTQKFIKQRKDKIAKPQIEALRELREFFRPVEVSSKAAEVIVKDKILEYRKETEKKAKEKEDKISKKVEQGDMKFETGQRNLQKTKRVPSKVESKGGAVQFRKQKVAKIVDESKLPREYLVPNNNLIRKDALAGKDIPGVKVEEKEIVSGYGQ